MDTNNNVHLTSNEKISLLWIVVMFNMVFADILSFMLPGFFTDLISGNMPLEITETTMLIFALILQIPIAMIFLSRVLNNKTNRWANITASIITIVFVVGGGSLTLHYILFAIVEVLILLLIMNYSWKLKP